jgi:hypothetical protein
MRAISVAAAVIGCLITAQGLLGLAAPDSFLVLIREIQTPPIIYAAAAVRVLIGLILVRAARESRAPQFLLAFGCVVTAGGLLTPFFGVPFAKVILGWWSQGGEPVIRTWAAAALVLGVLVLSAVWPRFKRAA